MLRVHFKHALAFDVFAAVGHLRQDFLHFKRHGAFGRDARRRIIRRSKARGNPHLRHMVAQGILHGAKQSFVFLSGFFSGLLLVLGLQAKIA